MGRVYYSDDTDICDIHEFYNDTDQSFAQYMVFLEYVIVGDSSEEIQDALIIAGIKDIKENINYQIYPIGFKLYYGKEK